MDAWRDMGRVGGVVAAMSEPSSANKKYGTWIFKLGWTGFRPKRPQTPSLMIIKPFPSALPFLFYFYYGTHFPTLW